MQDHKETIDLIDEEIKQAMIDLQAGRTENALRRTLLVLTLNFELLKGFQKETHNDCSDRTNR